MRWTHVAVNLVSVNFSARWGRLHGSDRGIREVYLVEIDECCRIHIFPGKEEVGAISG